jgi:import inner membrane translocase subunit TIM50
MLISNALLKRVPNGVARTHILPSKLPLLVRPQPLSNTLPTSVTIQCLRHKSNRQGPRYPQQTSHSSSPNNRGPLSPRDLQYNPNRSARRAGSPAADAARQESLSEETAEFDTDAQPGRNATSDSQPGSGSIEQEPIVGREDIATDQPSQTPIVEDVPTQKSLPDLRHGIPSTFAEEFLKQKAAPNPANPDGETANAKSNVAGDAGEGASGGREEGELPKSAYQTSIDKRRERMATWLYVGFGLMGVTGALFLGRNWETEEEERAHMADAPSGWGFSLFWDRVKARLSGQMGYYTEPTFPKLLPDIDPAPPYTLILSLEDLMIHSEWTREHGWRTAKRPGVDYFLGYLSQYYELVLFTSLPVSAADQIVRKLDPYHFMTFPLFREATRYEKGQYVKVGSTQDSSCS